MLLPLTLLPLLLLLLLLLFNWNECNVRVNERFYIFYHRQNARAVFVTTVTGGWCTTTTIRKHENITPNTSRLVGWCRAIAYRFPKTRQICHKLYHFFFLIELFNDLFTVTKLCSFFAFPFNDQFYLILFQRVDWTFTHDTICPVDTVQGEK
jgi:hypothetical protein